MPRIWHARHRADQRVAVGRVRNGAVDDALDAGIGKDRHAVQRLFQPGGDALQIAFEKLILAGPFRPAATTRPSLTRAGVLIDPNQARLLFLPVIAGRSGVTHDGQFHQAVLELRQRFGDQILVFHICDGGIDAKPFANLARIAASRVDDMFAGHHTLFGLHPKLARG